MAESTLLNNILMALPELKLHHARTSPTYSLLEKIGKTEVESFFDDKGLLPKQFGPFGKITFPLFNMGAINSKDLFGLDELILFSYYWIHRNKYKRVLDIGANIGLHSLLFAKCGFEVQAFEPDPVHFQKLKEVMAHNQVTLKAIHCAAVSNRSGKAEFVRVLGNTTSNHLAGAKQPYGDLERFEVPLFNFKDLIKDADLVKMDVEGHEGEILLSTEASDWEKADAFVEIGSPLISEQIYNHFKRMNIQIFSQKTGWNRVQKLTDMPTTYKEGSIFISMSDCMVWN